MACVNGMPKYSVWYEVLPADAVFFEPSTPLVPGDYVDTSVTFENGSVYFQAYVQHFATGEDEKPIDLHVPYKGHGKTADCIFERPGLNHKTVASLPQMASVDDSCIIQYAPYTYADITHPPAKWNVTHLTMVDAAQAPLVTSSVEFSTFSGEDNEITFVPRNGQPAYVALGDSYSSGEGNPTFDLPTDTPGADMCHRSSAAWPRLLGVRPEYHLACSGATVFSLYESQQTLAPDNQSQLSRLQAVENQLHTTGTHVGRVTLTIGGNDIGFAAIIGDCFFRECLAHFDQNLAQVRDLRARLVTLINNIETAAPQAQVVLVGYPRLFPQNQSGNATCGWLTPIERDRANQLSLALDTVLQQAATATGVRFVSVQNALAGHELCTTDSWVFPVNPLSYGTDQRQAHPLVAGQTAVARMVATALGLPPV